MQDQVTSVPAVELMQAYDHASICVEQLAILNVLKVVGFPEEVKVSISRGKRSVMIEFEVADSDRGRIIGKNGHTISALRSVVGAVAGPSGTNYVITVLEDEENPHSSPNDGRRHRRR